MVHIKANTFLILVIFLKNTYSQENSDGILCSARTCSDYINENPCPSVPEKCRIQNSTHNGLILPSPDPCNCCVFCLENLNEGDDCAMGEVGGLIPNSICGPGLICQNKLCAQMSTVTKNPPVCSAAQGKYDKRRKDGGLGSFEIRPNCDGDGLYKPFKCVPGQTCFCVDENGVRIFGEIPYTSMAELVLKCDCPRKYYQAIKFFDRDVLHPNEHFRCTETGDYDTIQCIGDMCMCTDASDGAPTFPLKGGVEVSDISNTTLKECFNKDIHLTGKYYYDCAEEYIKILDEVNSYKKMGYDTVFEIEFPDCTLDGKYAPVQKGIQINNVTNEKETYYYCAAPDGSPIENYRSLDNTNMDCKCARTNLLLPKDAPEKPQCCLNGNFNGVQCRRGKCYCVDADGYQDVGTSTSNKIEVDIDDKDNLFCHAKNCYQSI